MVSVQLILVATQQILSIDLLIFFSFSRGPESGGGSGQHYSGNKPPLISGSPISGGKADNEKPVESNEDALNQHKVHVNNVSAFYRISCHLYSKYTLKVS